MEKITSVHNKRVKWLRRLLNSKHRRAEKVVIAEGVRLVELAATAKAAMHFCLVTKEAMQKERVQQLLLQLNALSCPCFETRREVYQTLSDTDTPQGILLVLEEPHIALSSLAASKESLIVVLDAVQDPGNAGTIIRTADAAGADAVICLEGTIDVFSTKAVRASMGSIFHIPVISTISHRMLQDFLRQRQVTLLAADLDEMAKPYYQAAYRGKLALAFGSESNGISHELAQIARQKIFIPMFGKAESLNVATAAALILFEAARVRHGFFYHDQ